ncbi:MAG: DUF1631 family protein [Gammaproteobacteria bacterium]|nr:MAG: DUF1631 family protein [Gammaproteobacteria bacterium]
MNQKAATILSSWRAQTIERLCDGLNLLLDNVGETLVDFAAKSENVDLQTSFFDAQHLLTMRGDMLLARFRDELEKFEQEATPKKPAPGDETLSLLEREEYERSVALETITNNCALRNQQNYHALKQRLSAIYGGRKFQLDDLPLNPKRVAHAFENSIDRLEVPSRVLLVLFTLFDRYVMGELDTAVSEINQRLAEAGVLPTIRYTIPKRSEPGQRANAASKDREPEDAPDSILQDEQSVSRSVAPTAEQTMNDISRLLSLQRRRRSYQELGEAPANYPPISPQESQRRVNEAIDSPQLAAQAPNPAPQMLVTRDNKVVVDKELLLKVRETLKKQRALIHSLMGGSRNVGEREQNAIDIVGMLFEAILDDETIPPQLKTLLSHLHTPYLKIAVNDPAFLNDEQHPARLLLDRMLQLGIRWVDPERLRTGIYPTLQYCVRKIIDSKGAPDYQYLSDEIERKASQLEQAKKVSEKRILESEKGQTMLQRARQSAESATQTLLRQHKLPTEVRIFFHTLFNDYLSLLLLRNQLDPQAPDCRQALDAAIQLIERIAQQDVPGAVAAGERLNQLIVQLLPHYEDKIASFQQRLPKLARGESALLTEMETAPELEPEEPEEELPEVDDAAVARVLEIPVGSWFLLQTSPSEQPVPVKLLWSNPHTRHVLFVDQHGLKRARMSLEQAALDLENGTLRPTRVRADGIFVRLLTSIKNKLETSLSTGTDA